MKVACFMIGICGFLFCFGIVEGIGAIHHLNKEHYHRQLTQCARRASHRDYGGFPREDMNEITAFCTVER